MILFKIFGVVILLMFVLGAIEGLIAFLIDVIRFPQKHESVKIVPSKEMAAKMKLGDDSVFEEELDGLYLDKPKNSIFGGDVHESNN